MSHDLPLDWYEEHDGQSLVLSSEKVADRVKEAADEIERLQRIIDSRPAINAGLPESYIKWSHSIYELEFARATQARS